MKNKKILVTAIFAVMCTVVAFATVSISFGPAYTNYFTQGKIESDKLPEQLASAIKGSAGMFKDKNNAAGFSLDIHGDFMYFMTQFAFPTKVHSDFFNSEKSPLKKGSLIVDSQLGAGYTFFKESPFNLFLGGGVGLNIIKNKHSVSIGPISGSYEKFDTLLGAGLNVLASFYFTNHIGIFGGVADTLYFIPIKQKKTVTLAGVSYSFGNAPKSKTLANSLNVKLGLALKF